MQSHVAIILAHRKKSPFFSVFDRRVRSVTFVSEGVEFRKFKSTNAINRETFYWVAEINEQIMTDMWFAKLDSILDNEHQFAHKFCIGFKPFQGTLPNEWMSPSTTQEFIRHSGLKAVNPSRLQTSLLFNQHVPRVSSRQRILRQRQRGIRQRQQSLSGQSLTNHQDGVLVVNDNMITTENVLNTSVLMQQIFGRIFGSTETPPITRTHVHGPNSNLFFFNQLGRRMNNGGQINMQNADNSNNTNIVSTNSSIETVNVIDENRAQAELAKKRKELKRKITARVKKKSKESDSNETIHSTTCVICYEDYYDASLPNTPENDNQKDSVVKIALLPCQHPLCIKCALELRDGDHKNICPIDRQPIKGIECYTCVTCALAKRPPKGPIKVVAMPCEHRIMCLECAEDFAEHGDLKCPLCKFEIEDVRVAEIWE